MTLTSMGEMCSEIVQIVSDPTRPVGQAEMVKVGLRTLAPDEATAERYLGDASKGVHRKISAFRNDGEHQLADQVQERLSSALGSVQPVSKAKAFA